MSYRPITDMWILARAKLRDGKKYYGAYPGGFPERARALLGVTINESLLHVCGGMARYYPYAGGFGPNDRTLDVDPKTEPDWLQDVRAPLPDGNFKAMLADPPYSPEDAEHYATGSATYPNPRILIKDMLSAVIPGGRVGLLHYVSPSPPKDIPTKLVAMIGVVVGFNNRIRIYTVYERLT